MATTTLKHKDGSTSTTTQAPDALGHDLQLSIGSVAAGYNVYVKESQASNGDKTYRFNRFEPPAK